MVKRITFVILSAVLLTEFANGSDKSICFGVDHRFPSNDPKVGRVQRPDDKSGCTATLVGRSCAISAGHCKRRFQDVHFNVPDSSADGKIHPSKDFDIYPLDKESIIIADNGKGDDYAVFRLAKNPITNEFPGDTQGYYPVSFSKVYPGDGIRIISFGADRDEGDEHRNYTQQTSSANIIEVQEGYLSYQADTWGGSSGAPVIDNEGKVIGIHTHGDCNEEGGRNSGTSIHSSLKLRNAILDCLLWERLNL